MRKLKHEGYEVLDVVRCWDFEQMEGRRDRFVEGCIIEVCRNGNAQFPFAHYKIEVLEDSAFPSNPREIVYAPMEVLMLEWDNRIELVAKPKRRAS